MCSYKKKPEKNFRYNLIWLISCEKLLELYFRGFVIPFSDFLLPAFYSKDNRFPARDTPQGLCQGSLFTTFDSFLFQLSERRFQILSEGILLTSAHERWSKVYTYYRNWKTENKTVLLGKNVGFYTDSNITTIRGLTKIFTAMYTSKKRKLNPGCITVPETANKFSQTKNVDENSASLRIKLAAANSKIDQLEKAYALLSSVQTQTIFDLINDKDNIDLPALRVLSACALVDKQEVSLNEWVSETLSLIEILEKHNISTKILLKILNCKAKVASLPSVDWKILRQKLFLSLSNSNQSVPSFSTYEWVNKNLEIVKTVKDLLLNTRFKTITEIFCEKADISVETVQAEMSMATLNYQLNKLKNPLIKLFEKAEDALRLIRKKVSKVQNEDKNVNSPVKDLGHTSSINSTLPNLSVIDHAASTSIAEEIDFTDMFFD